MDASKPLYPIALKLDGRRCLVVGGGEIALRKTRELLNCGAVVRVVAPEWPADFAPLEAEPNFRRSSRSFQASDLDGVFLVVAATDDATVQQVVARGAGERSILCNVVDVNPLCNFYLPAILRRGPLTISVSTEGMSPLFAVALRDRLAGVVGEEVGPGLDRLGEGRAIARARFPHDAKRRREALIRLLTPRAFQQLMEGRREDFEAHWQTWKSSLSD